MSVRAVVFPLDEVVPVTDLSRQRQPEEAFGQPDGLVARAAHAPGLLEPSMRGVVGGGTSRGRGPTRVVQPHQE